MGYKTKKRYENKSKYSDNSHTIDLCSIHNYRLFQKTRK